MKTLKIMVNGLPGKMASKLAEIVYRKPGFELFLLSLTGSKNSQAEFKIGSNIIKLIDPDKRKDIIDQVKKERVICIDFTLPSAIESNVDFYCRNSLPFVIGTTGIDPGFIENRVKTSAISAVAAPNMARQIVGFQAMLEYASAKFPDMFKGYTLKIKESHQQGKADTSGTAKAMVKYFKYLGIPFLLSDIKKERNPEIQKTELHVPLEYLEGHAWHTYTLISPDNTVKFEFTHNVNGRSIYAQGALEAALYLDKKLKQGSEGRVFSMIDVLKG